MIRLARVDFLSWGPRHLQPTPFMGWREAHLTASGHAHTGDVTKVWTIITGHLPEQRFAFVVVDQTTRNEGGLFLTCSDLGFLGGPQDSYLMTLDSLIQLINGAFISIVTAWKRILITLCPQISDVQDFGLIGSSLTSVRKPRELLLSNWDSYWSCRL